MATIDMGLKEGDAVRLLRSAGNTSNTMWPARSSTSVPPSSIQPFGHSSLGCHWPCRNINTNYYFVVEMHTVTVRSDDARYLLKIQLIAWFKTTKLIYKILPLKLSIFSIKILIARAI